MASRQLMIPRIAATGTSFSPLPCQAWHGYGVTSAHRVEVEVGADGSASAPPSGAAAAGPPAGARIHCMVCTLAPISLHLAPPPSHVMSHVVGGLAQGIGAAVHTISLLLRARASFVDVFCPCRVCCTSHAPCGPCP
jgi:hypothetical protein